MTGNCLVLILKVCEPQKELPTMRPTTTEALKEEHGNIRTPDRRNKKHSSLKNTQQSM